MYAVVRTGGKQYRVEPGGRLEIERLRVPEGAEVKLKPLLVVDGDQVLSRPTELGEATVTARVLGEGKGQKVSGFTYRSKSNERRRYGHRQNYSLVEVLTISAGGKTATAPPPEKTEPAKKAPAAKKTPPKKAPATKKTPAKKTPAKKKPAKKAPAVEKAPVKKKQSGGT
ncbi:MAG: 50S ribosomal protein L21 [Acidimicrobiia bacterium]